MSARRRNLFLAVGFLATVSLLVVGERPAPAEEQSYLQSFNGAAPSEPVSSGDKRAECPDGPTTGCLFEVSRHHSTGNLSRDPSTRKASVPAIIAARTHPQQSGLCGLRATWRAALTSCQATSMAVVARPVRSHAPPRAS